MNLLFMDDNGMTKKVAEEMLESLGHKVDFVSNGAEALSLYKKRKEGGSSFNAVILDIVIPEGMGGIETLKNLLEIDPQAKVIALTGFSKESVITNHKEYGFINIIEKPFSVDDLKAVLNQTLKDK